MYPHLIYIPTGVDWLGPIDLPAYFTMVMVGYTLSILLLRRWGLKNGVSAARLIDLGLYMVLFGIGGARLLHIFVDGHFWDYVNACVDPSKVDWDVSMSRCEKLGGVWDSAAEACHPAEKNCWAWAQVWNGGFVFYGGLIAASAFGIWFIIRQKMPLLKILDAMGWAIPFGVFWGRMGCFLGGCCFGARTDLPWGVSFPAYSPAAHLHFKMGLLAKRGLASLPVHPTQLYEGLFMLILSAVIYFYIGPRRKYHGQMFCIMIAGYAVFRFLVEFIRRDERGGLWLLSTSQIISILGIAVIIWAAGRFRAMSQGKT